MKIASVAAILSFSILSAVSEPLSIYYLGILPGSAPQLEKNLERIIKTHLLTTIGMVLVDQDAIDLIRNKIPEDKLQSPSPTLIKELPALNTSSAKYLIWAKVDKCEVVPVRRRLIQSLNVGTLEVTFAVYNLDQKRYEYFNTISSDTTAVGPYIFFGDIQKSEMVSSPQRIKIFDQLQNLMAVRITAVLQDVFKQKLTPATEEAPPTPRVPSTADIFNIPTVDAPSLYPNQPAQQQKNKPPSPAIAPPDKKNSTASDSTTKKKP